MINTKVELLNTARETADRWLALNYTPSEGKEIINIANTMLEKGTGHIGNGIPKEEIPQIISEWKKDGFEGVIIDENRPYHVLQRLVEAAWDFIFIYDMASIKLGERNRQSPSGAGGV